MKVFLNFSIAKLTKIERNSKPVYIFWGLAKSVPIGVAGRVIVCYIAFYGKLHEIKLQADAFTFFKKQVFPFLANDRRLCV